MPHKNNALLSWAFTFFLIITTVSAKAAPNQAGITYHIQYKKQAQQLIKTINPLNMWHDLAELTRFPHRFSESIMGRNVASKLRELVADSIAKSDRTDVSIRYVETGQWIKQPSLVIKIGDSNQPGIVIGAHMDTRANLLYNMPGADDDGSGTVTVLELARVLLSSHMQFNKPIYLIWYAANEVGLLGASYIIADFNKNNISISAVLQLDMTGYEYRNDPTVWIMEDHVDKELSTYLETLVHTYVHKPVRYTRSGYASSDHAIWDKAGIPAAMPLEAAFNKRNPYIHSINDSMDKLTLNHMTSFAKLAVAFTVELAEPIN